MTLWTPAKLAVGAKLWLKADSLALSNGASVVTWPDSSAYAADAVTVLNSPTFQTNQLNSLPIVRFAQSGPQVMAAQPVATTVHSVFAVGRYTNAAPATSFRVISGDGAHANWLLGWWGDGGTGRTDTYWFAGGNLAGPTNSLWHMYVATSDGATTIIYSDGSVLYTDVGGAIGGLGNFLVLAGSSAGGASENSDCEIAEVLIFDYKMSPGDRWTLEGYLAWKWGRQASLVAGHPFAGAAPSLDFPPRRSSIRR